MCVHIKILGDAAHFGSFLLEILLTFLSLSHFNDWIVIIVRIVGMLNIEIVCQLICTFSIVWNIGFNKSMSPVIKCLVYASIIAQNLNF